MRHVTASNGGGRFSLISIYALHLSGVLVPVSHGAPPHWPPAQESVSGQSPRPDGRHCLVSVPPAARRFTTRLKAPEDPAPLCGAPSRRSRDARSSGVAIDNRIGDQRGSQVSKSATADVRLQDVRLTQAVGGFCAHSLPAAGRCDDLWHGASHGASVGTGIRAALGLSILAAIRVAIQAAIRVA
eukprot:scaffold1330_cov240-Pinguiococcus_pyrenoidosus.AAC.22